MFKSIVNLLLLIAILSLTGCAGEEVEGVFLAQEKNQVWSVKNVDGEHSKDKITYLETYEYDQDGNEIGHLIYNTEGQLSGKELSVFDKSQKQPIGTRYYTAQDSLLSYYQLTYDKKGRKTTRKGYDASNDELLRIENFSYDDKDNMIKKEVRTADGQLISSFEFKYDAFGNKTSMTSKDGNGNIRVSEDYKITKRDDQKRWLENWGWRGDQPVTFRVRELVYEDRS